MEVNLFFSSESELVCESRKFLSLSLLSRGFWILASNALPLCVRSDGVVGVILFID
jgi:hypothetical protein